MLVCLSVAVLVVLVFKFRSLAAEVIQHTYSCDLLIIHFLTVIRSIILHRAVFCDFSIHVYAL